MDDAADHRDPVGPVPSGSRLTEFYEQKIRIRFRSDAAAAAASATLLPL
jgi:hypothetical protein